MDEGKDWLLKALLRVLEITLVALKILEKIASPKKPEKHRKKWKHSER